MIAHFADRARYPALARIVLAGHSGGAQIVQRYAAVGHPAAGVAIRFVVADPSSYLRFDPIAGACPAASRWKYALAGAPSYVGAPSPAAAEAAYAARDIVYLLGAADDDPNHPELDRSCAGEAQGPDRLARGLAFFRAMQAQEGAALRQSVVLLPGVTHNVRRAFTAPCAIPVLLGALAGCATR